MATLPSPTPSMLSCYIRFVVIFVIYIKVISTFMMSCTEIPGVVIYAMIISGAVVVAVGWMIAIYCKTKCQGKSHLHF